MVSTMILLIGKFLGSLRYAFYASQISNNCSDSSTNQNSAQTK